MNEDPKDILLMELLLRVKVLEKLLIENKILSEEVLNSTMDDLLLKASKTIIENTIQNATKNT